MPRQTFLRNATDSYESYPTRRYPLSVPTSKTTVGKMFPGSYGWTDFETWYDRYPFPRFYIEDVTDVCWDQLFRVQKERKTLDWTENFLTHFREVALESFRNAHKSQRLYGDGVLLLIHSDIDAKNPKSYSIKPIEKATVNKTWYFTAKQYTPSFIDENGSFVIPKAPQKLQLTINNLPTEIHPDRYIYLENPDLLHPDQRGISVLKSLGDIIQVKRHGDWAIGQRLWRASVGFLELSGPKTITDEQRDQILDYYQAAINAMTVHYIPDGFKSKTQDLTTNLNISDAYAVIWDNLAMGSGIPKSVMKGSDKGAIAARKEDMFTFYNYISSIQNNFQSKWIEEYIMKSGDTVPDKPDKFTIAHKPAVSSSPEEEEIRNTISSIMRKILGLLKNPQLSDKDIQLLGELFAGLKESARLMNVQWRPRT